MVPKCIHQGAVYRFSKDELLTSAFQAVQDLPTGSQAVVVIGYGMWDLVFSTCPQNETLDYLAEAFKETLDAVVLTSIHAAKSRGLDVDFYIRNSFYSYKSHSESWGNVTILLNDIVESSFKELLERNAGDPSVRFRLLDVYALSEPRRDEMPYNGDGLHWACISKANYQYCHHGLRSDKRPDEVAWAAMQLILLDFCDIYSL